MKINFRLKQIRKKRKITQTQLAKDLGVTQVQISRWENLTYKPTLEKLKQIVLYFDVTADYLLGMSEDEHSYVNYNKIKK